MGNKEEKEVDDKFDVLAEITEMDVDEEEKTRLAEKAERKRLRKEITKEEKEEQRKINRENREKKKLKKELNKKRKKGELKEEESEEEEDEEPKLDAEGNVIEKPKKKLAKDEKKKKEMEYGIWVGNLSYATTLATIKDFFKDCGEITRIKCPKEAAKGVAMSEKKLEGRSLLIKDSENFERADGSKAPTEAEKKEIKKQKNPPCPTLFLGNLSFDTTEASIRENFGWAGDIRKVRVATFEDSGKCKGFAYVDYFEVDAATKAIRAPDKHMLDGRKCRVEFGSAEAHMRSKPWLMREQQKASQPKTNTESKPTEGGESTELPYRKRQRDDGTEGVAGGDDGYVKRQRGDADFRERRPKKPVSHERVKPGQALYAAQRQKPSVQEFKGAKTVFE
ncbi:unnamed protein product [Mucor hiemalis]